MEQLVFVMEKGEPLPVGTHAAKLVEMDEMDGPHGPMVRLRFRVNYEEGIHEVTALASKKLSQRSKLGRWVSAILGREIEVGENITASDLTNRPCLVKVEHKTTDDGYVFDNVVDIESEVPF